MTQKEKLIEMLKKIYKEYSVSPSDDLIANYLISHGVVVLPCKVGDTVYQIDCGRTIVDRKVAYFLVEKDCINFAFYIPGFGVYITTKDEKVFLSREEAEAALKGKKE